MVGVHSEETACGHEEDVKCVSGSSKGGWGDGRGGGGPERLRRNQADALFSQVCFYLSNLFKATFSFFFPRLYTDSQTPVRASNHASIQVLGASRRQ